MRRLATALLGTAFIVVCPCIHSQELNKPVTTSLSAPQPVPEAHPGPEPTISLQALLEQVAANSNKEFLVDARAKQTLYIGGTPIEAPTYPILLSILRNNELVAVKIEDRVNIVPEAFARQLPVPLVQRDDADIPDDEWVSRVITVTKGQAAYLVPILRPLLPQAGHMAALGPDDGGKLLIVDRYANVRRVTEIVEALDR